MSGNRSGSATVANVAVISHRPSRDRNSDDPLAPLSVYRQGLPGDAWVPMQQGIGDASAEQSPRRQAELGRLLAAAKGYRVLASDGTHVGWLDYVRDERHADPPDIVLDSPGRPAPGAAPRLSLQRGRGSQARDEDGRPAQLGSQRARAPELRRSAPPFRATARRGTRGRLVFAWPHGQDPADDPSEEAADGEVGVGEARACKRPRLRRARHSRHGTVLTAG